MRPAVLTLLSLFLLLLTARPASAGCDGLSQTGCTAAPNCVWCVAAAVPSACYTKADAERLPPAVFTCRKGEVVAEQVMMTVD